MWKLILGTLKCDATEDRETDEISLTISIDNVEMDSLEKDMSRGDIWQLDKSYEVMKAFELKLRDIDLGCFLDSDDLLGTEVKEELKAGEFTARFQEDEADYILTYNIVDIEIDFFKEYPMFKTYEQEFQDAYVQSELLVGTFHADTGLFEHHLERGGGFIHEVTWEPKLPEKSDFQICDPDASLDPSIKFEFLLNIAKAKWPLPIERGDYRWARDLALSSELVFKVQNHETTVYLRVYDIKFKDSNDQVKDQPKQFIASADVGQNEIRIWIGPSVALSWQIVCGDRNYNDSIQIERPRGLSCFGAFKEAAIPLAIVYEPPQCSLRKNYAIYTAQTWEQTKYAMGIGTESSTETEIKDVDGFIDALKSVKTASGWLSGEHPFFLALNKSLSTLNDALDFLGISGKGAYVKGSKASQDEALTISKFDQESHPTNEHMGPGLGDLFILMKGVKFAWVGTKGEKEKAKMLYMGSDGIISAIPANMLLDDLTNGTNLCGLPVQTLEELLALDPFVNASTPKLDPKRFEDMGTFEVFKAGPPDSNDKPHKFDKEVQISESHEYATTNYSSSIVERGGNGLLAFLGLQEYQKNMIKNIISNSTAESSGKKIAASVMFYPDNEPYAVHFYYDRTFGTFACTQESIKNYPMVSGIAQDKLGRNLACKQVTLIAGGKEYLTYTDEYGRFSFRSASIKPGIATLRLKTVSQTVILGLTPLHDVQLKSAI